MNSSQPLSKEKPSSVSKILVNGLIFDGMNETLIEGKSIKIESGVITAVEEDIPQTGNEEVIDCSGFDPYAGPY